VIHAARKRRIAAGAGLSVQEVNKLLKQHQQMQTMMKRVKKMGQKQFITRGLPPGLLPR
jgi:signal recognition particle subunit SRP54